LRMMAQALHAFPMSRALHRRALRRVGFILALALLAAAAAASVWSVRQAATRNAWVEHTYRVIATLQRYRASLRTVESAARGFRLAALPTLAESYATAVPKAHSDADALVRLVSDNPPQLGRARTLQQLTAQRLQLSRMMMQG